MAHGTDLSHIQIVEKFSLPAKMRNVLLGVMGVGILLLLLGIFIAPKELPQGVAHSKQEAEQATEKYDLNGRALAGQQGGQFSVPNEEGATHPHGPLVSVRFWANFLVDNVYFTGIALTALLFLAIQSVVDAGWYVIIKRVMEAMAGWIPVAAVLMFISLVGAHYLYDWMDPELRSHDVVLQSKSGWLNTGFFILKMVLYFTIWGGLYFLIRRNSLQEDLHGGLSYYRRTRALSAAFIILFAISFSAAAWDWLMSLEFEWFSTMYGVYVFASHFVASLAMMTIIAVLLKHGGFLPGFNTSHLHDLGKFVFAFSIFWTYIWFCQFMLIWYANIPEEGVYFYERLKHDWPFATIFFANIFINFVIPFLGLMETRAKRNYNYLAIICGIVIIGHWLDVYNMVMPGTMKRDARIGAMEIGMFLTWLAAFGLVVSYWLGKASLVPKHHPYLKETLLHSYHG